MLRFSEWFAPCKLKATVKRTTKTLRILPPTFKPVSQQIRLLQVAFILDSDWKNLRGSRAIRGSYVTYCKTSLPWASKTRATCTDFLQKVEQLSTFGSNFPQPATSWFVARQIWFVGGKTRNIAIEVFSHDVTAAILVSQTNPVDVELFSNANDFFCSNKFA